LILVDEINRATPKTQAALLEVMQEGAVTSGGETMPLPKPFFVMATQNPMEMEGTYPLPEAQADRFLFKLRVPFPDQETLVEISRRTSSFEVPELSQVITADELLEFQKLVASVPVADHVTEYAARIILATHPEQESGIEEVGRYVSYGASPRGMQSLIRGARVLCALDGRTAVSTEDVKRVALPALRHRVILNFQGEAESRDIDGLVDQVLSTITPGVAV
jgi:MoxR-like ATPase